MWAAQTSITHHAKHDFQLHPIVATANHNRMQHGQAGSSDQRQKSTRMQEWSSTCTMLYIITTAWLWYEDHKALSLNCSPATHCTMVTWPSKLDVSRCVAMIPQRKHSCYASNHQTPQVIPVSAIGRPKHRCLVLLACGASYVAHQASLCTRRHDNEAQACRVVSAHRTVLQQSQIFI